QTQGVVNYIGVTTRCCGPTVEARDHERKLTGPVPPKSLISRGLSGAPRACRRCVSHLLVRVTYVAVVHMRSDARPALSCPCCKGVTEPPGTYSRVPGRTSLPLSPLSRLIPAATAPGSSPG